MTKTRTTKKPAAKPQRKPRTAPTTPATADEIGRSVAKELGRTLRDLMDIPEPSAVGAWTVERPDVAGTQFTAHYDGIAKAQARISPVEEALHRLRGEISAAEVTTDIEMEKLDAVLVPVPQNTAGSGEAQQSPGYGQLAGVLNAFAERIAADNRRRANLLDRLEL